MRLNINILTILAVAAASCSTVQTQEPKAGAAQQEELQTEPEQTEFQVDVRRSGDPTFLEQDLLALQMRFVNVQVNLDAREFTARADAPARQRVMARIFEAHQEMAHWEVEEMFTQAGCRPADIFEIYWMLHWNYFEHPLMVFIAMGSTHDELPNGGNQGYARSVLAIEKKMGGSGDKLVSYSMSGWGKSSKRSRLYFVGVCETGADL